MNLRGMAGGKRKEPESSSVDQEASKKPKPSKPPKPLRKPGSKTDANGGRVRNIDNDFFSDEEAWIKIYYTLLARITERQVAMTIPPTTHILLLFNAYFQGFKEPIGSPHLDWNGRDWLLECVAVPTRIRRNLIEFETAVQRLCPDLKRQIDVLREERPACVGGDGVSAEASSLFVTPEQIASVLQETGKLDADGNPVLTTLDSLTLPDPTPVDINLWKDKAVARINARETRHPDDHPRHLDYKLHHWIPQDIPARSLHPGTQMVNRHEDAAYANAIINACPVPPLGFFKDLRELRDQDFNSHYYDGQEREIERIKHRKQVRVVRLSRKVNQARRLLVNCKDKYGGSLDTQLSIQKSC
jgi:hypothetical protein